MACNLSRDEMMALVERHEIAEGAADVEAAMATLCEETFHEFHPLGVFVTDRNTVAEMYRRSLPSQKNVVAGGERKNVWFTDDNVLVEYEFVVNGPNGPFTSRVIVDFGFRGDLIYSERVFLGPEHAAIYRATLGDDFLSLPGITVEAAPK